MNAATESHTRLHGRWLISAQLAWVAIVMLAGIMYMAAAPVAHDILRTPCSQEPCNNPFQPPSEMKSQAVLDFGAWKHSILETVLQLLALGVALLLFWRRSNDWMALLASLMLVTMIAVFSPSPVILTYAQPYWLLPRAIVWAIGLISTVALFYLFPDGRFVPRWTGMLATVFLVIIVGLTLAGAPFLAGFPVFIIALTTGAGFQIYRYRQVSSPLQRQQTKWVVFGIMGMVLPMLIAFFFAFLNPSVNPLLSTVPRSPLSEKIFDFILTFCIIIPFCFLPVTLAFSLLRYRLWDVDIFINRTLVYTMLTASVVGIYVLIVGWSSIGLQNQNNLAGSVFAVLVIGFLFPHLRRRLQHFADRFVPGPQTTLHVDQHKRHIAIPESGSTTDTRLQGHWLFIARLAWAAMFTTLTVMYVLSFLAVRDVLSTVCEEELCTLSQQIRSTAAGERVEIWTGPPIGFADRLRSDQIKALEMFDLTLDQYGLLFALQMGIPALAYLIIAAGLFWLKSDNWMALFASITIATLPLPNMPLAFTLGVRQPAWAWLVDVCSLVALLGFLTLPLVFPNGRLVPRWMRWIVWFELAWAVSLTLFRDSFLEIPSAINLVEVFIVTSFGAGVYAQTYRYFRAASLVERQQIKWVVVGLTGFIFISFLGLLPLNQLLTSRAVNMNPAPALMLSILPDILFQVILLFIPASIAISVMRYRLWDVDMIINRTLVYGALTGLVVGAFVILVGFLSFLFQSSGNSMIAIIATGLVALLFNPLRQRLQRSVNHLMYGDRDEPYTALSRLGRQLEASLAPETILPTIVTTVRDVLRLPYVAIYLQQESQGYKIVAESASPLLHIENGRIRVPGMEREGRCIPLVHQGETVGYVVLGPRAPNEAFSFTDLHLLDDLAPQVGVAVQAVRLTADLQRSRERLVLAREEERRRLRRNLHDDLGPTLASLGLAASTAADLIPKNPAAATELVKELESQVRETVGHVRRLVYDLRPPTLDELGLLAAVRERAARYSNAPNGIQVTVEAHDELPALPAAVEVAVYRIVQEALENVSKHSQAHQCKIHFAYHNGLEIEIMDDGIGLPSSIIPGVGLRSMRERAEELGGTCVVECGSNGGTHVFACLPIGDFDGTFAHPDRR